MLAYAIVFAAAVGTAGASVSMHKGMESEFGVGRDPQGTIQFNIADTYPAPAYTRHCGKIQRCSSCPH